jgi:hypothetical protein
MENKTSGRYFWLWIVFAVLLASVVGNFFFQRRQSQPVDTTVQESSQVPEGKVPTSYEIIESERRAEIGDIEEATYRVTIPFDIKQAQVEPTLRKIVADINKVEPELDQFFVLMYSDKEVVKGAYDVGRAIWAYQGEYGKITPQIAKSNNRSGYSVTIDIEPNIEEYLASRNRQETINGLSTEQRKAIFKDLVSLTDKAYDIADHSELTPGQWLDRLTQELELNRQDVVSVYTENYYSLDKLETRFLPDSDLVSIPYFSMLAESIIRVKYGLSDDVFYAIKTEGFEKNWY